MQIILPPTLAMMNRFRLEDKTKLKEFGQVVMGSLYVTTPNLDAFARFCAENEIELVISEETRRAHEGMKKVIAAYGENGFTLTFQFQHNSIMDAHPMWEQFAVRNQTSRLCQYELRSYLIFTIALRLVSEAGYRVEEDASLQWMHNNTEYVTIPHFERLNTWQPQPHQNDSVARLIAMNGMGVIGDDAGLGKCVDENTLIITSNGLLRSIKTMYELHKKSEVQMSSNEWIVPVTNMSVPSFNGEKIINARVENIYKQHVTAPMMKIKTFSGRTITCTLHHKFYMFNPTTGGEWKQSSSLKIGDRIAIPSSIYFNQSTNINQNIDDNCDVVKNRDGTIIIKRKIDNNYTQKSITIPNIFSNEFFEFMGWLLSEGCEGDYGRIQLISISQKDRNILDRIGFLFQHLFGLKANVDYNHWRTSTSSISVAEFFKSVGYEFGFKSQEKRFPHWILTAPIKLMNICLRSYFDGDGSFSYANGVLEVSSASEILAHQVYYMLLRNGIMASCSKMFKGKRLGLDNPHYILRVTSKEELAKFAQLIGFSIAYKMEALQKYLQIKNDGSKYNYGIPLDRDLFIQIRNDLHIYENNLGVSRSLILGIIQRNQRVSKNNLVLIFNAMLNKIQLFKENYDAIQKATNWRGIIKIAKKLNIGIQELSNLIETKIENLYYIIKKNKCDAQFLMAKQVITEISNKAQAYVSIIEKMRNDIINNYFDPIVSIEITEPYEHDVYDLYVPLTHNYIASNGILCHNSISAGMILEHYNQHKELRGIWVVPTIPLVYQMCEEMRGRFGVTCFPLTGYITKKMRLEQVYSENAFIIMTWTTFTIDWTRNFDDVKQIPFDFIIFDECHRLQQGNKAFDAALNFKCDIRIGLSGTPSPNGEYTELYWVEYALNPLSVLPLSRFLQREMVMKKKFMEHPIQNEDPERSARRMMNKIGMFELGKSLIRHSRNILQEALPKLTETKLHTTVGSSDDLIIETLFEILVAVIEEWKTDKYNKIIEFAKSMLWQDIRRFCSYGGRTFKHRVRSILNGEKPVHKYLQKRYSQQFRLIEAEYTKEAVMPYPKFAVLDEYLTTSDPSPYVIIFCDSVRTAIDMGGFLGRLFDVRVVTGEITKNGILDEGATPEEKEMEWDDVQEIMNQFGQKGRMTEEDVQEIIRWFWFPYADLSEFPDKMPELRIKYNIDGHESDRTYYVQLLKSREIKVILSPYSSLSSASRRYLNTVTKEMLELDPHMSAERIGLDYIITFHPTAPAKKRVLIATNKLSEGCNLQIARTIIFFDYPMSIKQREQRIARMQRMGSPYESLLLVAIMCGLDYAIERTLMQKYESVNDMGFVDPKPVSISDVIKMMRKIKKEYAVKKPTRGGIDKFVTSIRK